MYLLCGTSLCCHLRKAGTDGVCLGRSALIHWTLCRNIFCTTSDHQPPPSPRHLLSTRLLSPVSAGKFSCQRRHCSRWGWGLPGAATACCRHRLASRTNVFLQVRGGNILRTSTFQESYMCSSGAFGGHAHREGKRRSCRVEHWIV